MSRFHYLLCLLLAGFVLSCQKTPEEILVSSVSLSKTSLELAEGDSETLTATVKPDDAANKTVTWSTSNLFVATVSGGKVTAVSEGTAVITAKAGDKTAECKVTVSKRVIPVTLVRLNKTVLTLVEGNSETLTATVFPEEATDKTVTWSTSDPFVATVSDGKVTAVSEGTAVITAKAGDKTVECKVFVSKKVIAVTGVVLDKTSLELIKGESGTLTATVMPDDATDKTVTWSTSNASVATVADGTVTAVNGGSATITAKAGDKSATCTVVVRVPVEGITLDRTELDLVKGQMEFLSATVSPVDATDNTVTWLSSDPDIVGVDGYGVVYALNGGSAVITAEAGGKTATCLVTVTVPVEGIWMERGELTLEKGDAQMLVVYIYPEDATDQNVTWSSSDENIVEVDEFGMVVAKNGGTAVITATCGEYYATCEVTVIVPVTGIYLDKTELHLFMYKHAVLQATVEPEDATDKTVLWFSSDESIVTVNNEGRVTAVYAGTAEVTAVAGEMTATCIVTVTIPVESVILDLTSKTIRINETVQINAEVCPGDATNPTVTWSSSDPSVATVSSSGLVKGIKEGVVTITASAEDKSAVCTITVVRNTPGGHEGIGYDE